MSEHTPITGELREAVEWEPTFCGPDKAMVPQPEFDRICDAIDAVHAGLERENAELRERLAVLDESADSMHDGGSITDELRAWVRDGKGSLLAIADRIDAEHEAACAEAYGNGVMSVPIALDESAWVELPKDADGKPIHIGDVMDGTCPSGKHVNGTVNAIEDGVFWLSNVQFSLKPNYMHHHHAPTVEDVLTEFGIDWEHESDCEDRAALLKEYAAKLRLAGDAE